MQNGEVYRPTDILLLQLVQIPLPALPHHHLETIPKSPRTTETPLPRQLGPAAALRR